MPSMLNSLSSRLLILAAVTATGLVYFWPSVYKIGYGVLHRHGSSHGVFIPFLSAYFIYLKWDRLRSAPKNYCPPSVVALLLLGVPVVFPTSLELQFVALVLFTAMAILFCFGKQVFNVVLFPVLFSIAMVPIPQDLYKELADLTRRITFSTALTVLSILDIPFYKEGWLVKLPNALLEVAISCSGIRYLISYFVFGIAYAYLFRQSALGRSLLVATTIPVSLAASSLRLTIIFLTTHYISPRMAEYWPHVILSWCVFFVILFALVMLDQTYLARRKPSRELRIISQMGH